MDKKYNILVVDDDSNNIQLAINILKSNKNYNIIFATNGKDALQSVQEYDFDIIILDILMEPMNGYEVCEKLKNDDKTSTIPIIFLTAKNDEESIYKGFEVGGVDYITKPFFEKEFSSRVSTHLELKRLRDKLEEELKEKDRLMLQQNKMATMGEMIDNIAHQWRQPLSVISTISSNLIFQKETGMQSESKTEVESLQDIVVNVEHLSQTITDFRDFFRPKDKIEFDIHSVVEKTLSLVSKNIISKNITINNLCENIKLEGYDNELIQVLINIINNAIEILENKDIKLVNISSYVDEIYINISVKDTGGGIDNSIIDKVFDQNFTTKEDGTGIGLYMSKMIVKDHFNGTITVQNSKTKIDNKEYLGAEFIIKIKL